MKKIASTFVFTALTLAVGAAAAQAQPVIGLITKTESNPFFVKMKEGADAEAKKLGAKLLSAAGKTDGDNAGQVTAMENMIAAGAKTILITPSDAKAIIPANKKAQGQGVMVIALDSPTDPAACSTAVLSSSDSVQAAGSGSVDFHTFARNVVGLVPAASTLTFKISPSTIVSPVATAASVVPPFCNCSVVLPVAPTTTRAR